MAIIELRLRHVVSTYKTRGRGIDGGWPRVAQCTCGWRVSQLRSDDGAKMQAHDHLRTHVGDQTVRAFLQPPAPPPPPDEDGKRRRTSPRLRGRAGAHA